MKRDDLGYCDSEYSQEVLQSTVSTLQDNYTHIIHIIILHIIILSTHNNPSSRETVQDIKKQSKKT